MKRKIRKEAKKEKQKEKAATDTKPERKEEKLIEIAEPEAKEDINKPVNYSKQTKAVILFMAVALISIAAIYWFAQEGKTTSFQGIEFQKTKEGTLVFYKSLMGYVTSSGEEIPFVLKLRTDPKKLEEVPVKGEIRVLEEAIITVSPSVLRCPDASITLFDIGWTLKAFGTDAEPATTDKNYSIEKNFTWADCRHSTNKTVIMFREGNETQIEQGKLFENCYRIEIKDCDIRSGYERFLLGYLQDSFIEK